MKADGMAGEGPRDRAPAGLRPAAILEENVVSRVFKGDLMYSARRGCQVRESNAPMRWQGVGSVSFHLVASHCLALHPPSLRVHPYTTLFLAPPRSPLSPPLCMYSLSLGHLGRGGLHRLLLIVHGGLPGQGRKTVSLFVAAEICAWSSLAHAHSRGARVPDVPVSMCCGCLDELVEW